MYEALWLVAGPACSDTVEPLVGVAETFQTVVMSYSAEGAIFNYSKYPYFFRTIPENKIYGYGSRILGVSVQTIIVVLVLQ